MVRTAKLDSYGKKKCTGSPSRKTRLTLDRAWVLEMDGKLVKTSHVPDFQARLTPEVVFQ